jgi:hypothetical protein
MIVTNGKIYERCAVCDKLVRLNKFFFGSLHVCLSEAEKQVKAHYEQIKLRQLGMTFRNPIEKFAEGMRQPK